MNLHKKILIFICCLCEFKTFAQEKLNDTQFENMFYLNDNRILNEPFTRNYRIVIPRPTNKIQIKSRNTNNESVIYNKSVLNNKTISKNKPVLDKSVLDKSVLDKSVLDKSVLDKYVLGKSVLDQSVLITNVTKHTEPAQPIESKKYQNRNEFNQRMIDIINRKKSIKNNVGQKNYFFKKNEGPNMIQYSSVVNPPLKNYNVNYDYKSNYDFDITNNKDLSFNENYPSLKFMKSSFQYEPESYEAKKVNRNIKLYLKYKEMPCFIMNQKNSNKDNMIIENYKNKLYMNSTKIKRQINTAEKNEGQSMNKSMKDETMITQLTMPCLLTNNTNGERSILRRCFYGSPCIVGPLVFSNKTMDHMYFCHNEQNLLVTMACNLQTKLANFDQKKNISNVGNNPQIQQKNGKNTNKNLNILENRNMKDSSNECSNKSIVLELLLMPIFGIPVRVQLYANFFIGQFDKFIENVPQSINDNNY